VRQGDKDTLAKVVSILSEQDYTGGLFVDDAFGAVPGTLPMSAVGLKGSAVTPQPSLAISFATSDTGWGDPMACGVEVADSRLQQGQGMHGTFGRADTMNTMGVIGPDFRDGFTDTPPASNADLSMTIASILNLDIPAKGELVGRVLSEALKGGGPVPTSSRMMLESEKDASGHVTRLAYQVLGTTYYFDAAGYPTRTVGLQ